METRAALGGVPLRLLDTAGIRDSSDLIERQGVSRAEAAASGASLALAVFDASEPLTADDFRALETARRAAECIRANVFWPPGPSGDWKWDFAGLFVTDPQTDLQDGDWAKRQKAKLGGEEVCHA